MSPDTAPVASLPDGVRVAVDVAVGVALRVAVAVAVNVVVGVGVGVGVRVTVIEFVADGLLRGSAGPCDSIALDGIAVGGTISNPLRGSRSR